MAAKLSRRDLLRVSGLASGGLILAVYLDACTPGTEAPTFTALGGTPGPAFKWDADIYIKLDQDAVLTFTAFRSEMGQGVRTALAILVADEVDVEWSNVRIVQADADPRYGNQSTGGSQSIYGTRHCKTANPGKIGG